MAGAALIFTYQWRSHWRRVLRLRDRTHFYLLALAVLAWVLLAMLAGLSKAARELSAGQTTTIERTLLIVCMACFVALLERPASIISSQHLLRFPLNVRSLIAVRLLSVLCSPVVLLALVGSVISFVPFLSAPHPILGVVAALLLFLLVLGIAMSVPEALNVGEWRYPLLALFGVVGAVFVAFLVVEPRKAIEVLRAATALVLHFSTRAAVGQTRSAALLPILGLLAIDTLVWGLFVGSFRHGLFSQQVSRSAGRAAAPTIRLPGRLGGLVAKELRYFRSVLDPWMGLTIVIVVSAVSLFLTPTPLVHQVAMLFVFASDFNLSTNGFGLDQGSALNRYFILPVRGRDILLAKNLALVALMTAQLSLLLATALRSGIGEAGIEVLETGVLMSSHLAWGNIMTVSRPFRMRFYRLAASGDSLTKQAGIVLCSMPAVAMIYLLRSDSSLAPGGIILIVLMVAAAYHRSLQYAGRLLEHRRDLITLQLS